jgi:hypothetical protein
VNATRNHGNYLSLYLSVRVDQTSTLRWRLSDLDDKRDDIVVNLEAQFRREHQEMIAVDLFFHGSKLVITLLTQGALLAVGVLV